MNRRTSDAALFVYVVACLAGMMFAALALGGCSSEVAALRTTQPTEWSVGKRDASMSAAPRGPILIRVHIVDTDPHDDVVLSFVFMCSRVVQLLRGEGVQP